MSVKNFIVGSSGRMGNTLKRTLSSVDKNVKVADNIFFCVPSRYLLNSINNYRTKIKKSSVIYTLCPHTTIKDVSSILQRDDIIINRIMPNVGMDKNVGVIPVYTKIEGTIFSLQKAFPDNNIVKIKSEEQIESVTLLYASSPALISWFINKMNKSCNNLSEEEKEVYVKSSLQCMQHLLTSGINVEDIKSYIVTDGGITDRKLKRLSIMHGDITKSF